MHDDEPLVLKGYGWLLKEATRHYQDEVYQYILEHKHEMPRVALRYAIEKLPTDMKDIAMKK
jgi:3-methyladenine DNA glycosylase AlkD